jgi:chorismate mutase
LTTSNAQHTPSHTDGTDSDPLAPLRERLDGIDDRLAGLIAERLSVCVEIGEVKRVAGIPMMQAKRVSRVRAAWAERGERLGVSPELMRSVVALLVEESCRLEDLVIAGLPAAPEGRER